MSCLQGCVANVSVLPTRSRATANVGALYHSLKKHSLSLSEITDTDFSKQIKRVSIFLEMIHNLTNMNGHLSCIMLQKFWLAFVI